MIMSKTGYYLLALLAFAAGVLGLVLSGYALVLTLIGFPAALVLLMLGVSAGRKEGDIPFVGY